MKIKSLPVKFKTSEADGLTEGQFLVYPSTFTRTPDSYGDVVAKGAFLRGIVKRRDIGVKLPGLFGHRMDDPHMYVATAIDEGEDEHGWWVKGEFDLDDPTALKVYKLVKSGRIRELSFAYDVLDGDVVELDDGTKAYELRDLDVFEYSFVPVGANRDTSVVAVKSAVDALVDGVKAGRVLSAKNETTLRDAAAAMEAALASIKSVLPDDPDGADGAGTDQEKASGNAAVKDEGAGRVKSEGRDGRPSAADAWQLSIAAKAYSNDGLRLIPREGIE
ncbi:HK97 family phage prohead protease [Microbacterium resistens]|uniref:HK97 family phage prohead protease n=1 Tax=Microbacterium resistens TaxID=156977 RepID=A0ABY3RTN6_9MICO|nr:HK97 family phage prohead protease [Microbacterium resistens]UGS26330.1 HK97 family phage prohead protease [Microbacterium resistens]